MTGRVGRPRTDKLALVERVAGLLAVEPDLSAGEVYRRLGGRRSDVLRAVKAIRVAMSTRASGDAEIPFPNRENGVPS